MRAQRQLACAARWWDQNRDKAPEAFEEDVAEAYSSLAETPHIGQPVPSRRGGMRRLLLKRICYYMYYRVNAGEVEITAIWHASRRPPKL